MRDTMGGFSPESEPKPGAPSRWRVRLGAVSVLGSITLGLLWPREDNSLPTREPGRMPRPSGPQALSNEDEKLAQLATSVVKDANAIWARDFQRRNKPYTAAEPVLLPDASAAVCGLPGSALGRSQCEGNKAFIDLSFQRDLEGRHGAAADAARAYAVAHEMGHHVQRVLGIDAKVEELLSTRPVATHSVQVQLELQADCLAGVWSRSTGHRHSLEPDVIEAALRQASELGTERSVARRDDNAPYAESFTYAIPRRRIYWFQLGFARGNIEGCDTFAP